MKRFFGLFFAAAMLLSLGSCTNTGTDDTVTEQHFPSCFEYVHDLSTGVNAIYSPVGYTLRLNYSKATADVTITGLRTPQQTYPQLKLTDLSWSIDKGATVVSGRNVEASSASAQPVLLSSFTLKVKDRLISSGSTYVYKPGFSVYYTIDGRYSVLSGLMDKAVMYGTTTTTCQKPPISFSTDATSYELVFDTDTRTVNIIIKGARFMENMQPLEIVLEDVPIAFYGSKVTWTAEKIVPKIGGVPYKTFPISNLSGEYDFSTEMKMEFDCNPETVPGAPTFHVSAECTFNDDLGSDI
ncbi:MAG: hypothetical protein K2J38_00155 [Muribaculaceae bacterium]|nr:hypothetical protein [Muribaculaceae bacterium]